MDTHSQPAKPAPKRIRGLEDQVVKYDLKAMIAEAQTEFDAAISRRDLIDQKAISQMFNLKERLNARN